jgi:nitrogen regulatory protein P-II 1
MTKIEAIVRPSAIEKLGPLLSHPWIAGITVSEVKGVGRQKGHVEVYRGAEYEVDLQPKLKLEVVVPTPLVPRIVDDLTRLLRTGRIGDGKIFIVPIDEAIRIRTGDRGEEAL